mgnify:CR=1 FL=1
MKYLFNEKYFGNPKGVFRELITGKNWFNIS